MMRQVRQRDRVPVVRQFRHIAADVIRPRQFAIRDQQRDGCRRELFGNRGNVKDGFRRVRHIMFEIGHAVAAREDHLAAPAHPNDAAGRPRVVPFGKNPVDSFDHGVVEPRGGMSRLRREERKRRQRQKRPEHEHPRGAEHNSAQQPAAGKEFDGS